MSPNHWQAPFRGHAVLIWGALGATLLGALTALQLDLIMAAGERLMHPVGQKDLIRTTVTASLTGLLCWVICALVTRAITRAAVKPYDALADHLERAADGAVDVPFDLHGQVAGARRLARAISVLHQRALASQRSEALLRARYDTLHQEQADERRLLMGMLMSGRLDPQAQTAVLPPPTHAAPVGREGDAPTSATRDAAGGPTARTGRYDSLYQDAEERRLLMEMLLTGQLDPEEPASVLGSAAEAPFGRTGSPPSDARAAPPPHNGRVVDPTGRMKFHSRPAEELAVPDLMMNFAVIRR